MFSLSLSNSLSLYIHILEDVPEGPGAGISGAQSLVQEEETDGSEIEHFLLFFRTRAHGITTIIK